MTRERFDKFIRSPVLLLVTLGVLIVAVFAFQYNGRVEIHDNLIAGCQRSLVDRSQQASALGAILLGFQQTDKRLGGPDKRTPERIEAENILTVARDGLEARAKLDCNKLYPKPGLFG